jgi:hypothetical protein
MDHVVENESIRDTGPTGQVRVGCSFHKMHPKNI